MREHPIDKGRQTESEIIAGFCNSPRRLMPERERQTEAYRTGRALSGHVASAHKGIEDPKCRACKELRVRCGM